MKLSELKMLVDTTIELYGDLRLYNLDREENGMTLYEEIADIDFDLLTTAGPTEPKLVLRVG